MKFSNKLAILGTLSASFATGCAHPGAAARPVEMPCLANAPTDPVLNPRKPDPQTQEVDAYGCLDGYHPL